MAKPSSGKGSTLRPMTPEGRKNYEQTLAAIYGVRVKIPPPGPEQEALVERLARRHDTYDYKHNPCGICTEEEERCTKCWMRVVLELLTREATG
jgi:hypothetical protein